MIEHIVAYTITDFASINDHRVPNFGFAPDHKNLRNGPDDARELINPISCNLTRVCLMCHAMYVMKKERN